MNYERLSAREFRYDGSGRRRYLMRERDPATLKRLPAGEPGETVGPHVGIWSDYDGESAYSDFAYDPEGGVSPLRSFEPGQWRRDTSSGGTTDSFVVGDQIGTMRSMVATDSGAVEQTRAVYTAFGERVFETTLPSLDIPRHNYAGAHGYEGGPLWIPSADEGGGAVNGDPDDALAYLHVGERLYDPGSGRFLQRDPIGIEGGINSFTYVEGNAVAGVDPLGTQIFMPASPMPIHTPNYKSPYLIATIPESEIGGNSVPPVGFRPPGYPFTPLPPIDISINPVNPIGALSVRREVRVMFGCAKRGVMFTAGRVFSIIRLIGIPGDNFDLDGHITKIQIEQAKQGNRN